MTHKFADPYKRCRSCGAWVDGVEEVRRGPGENIPCRHETSYDDVCPSWSPVDGCKCDPKGHGRKSFAEGQVR